ncbi:hypothetical protein C2E15_03290 [Mixta gaviniae]|uniref:Uncharacterized protein n=1 Tax=Mixta gaviniae TaxID=665914 RepID=A0A2L0ICI5_9GAMM|nr:hypothetical protein C2E15_03290 [Mixta gaviniae]
MKFLCLWAAAHLICTEMELPSPLRHIQSESEPARSRKIPTVGAQAGSGKLNSFINVTFNRRMYGI